MSGEPNSKRRKMSSFHKNKPYNRNQKAAKFLEPGIKGFLATCNFREKDCVRECYNLLNEYVDLDETEKVADEASESPPVNAEAGATVSDDDVEEEDISTQLENEIKTITATSKADRTRFQQVETKTPNCVFIRTTVADPVGLGVKIVRDIAETKKQKTRILLRFIPVEVVCKATIEDIENAAGKLFDKYFLNVEPKTFSIVVNKRYNNSIDRMKIIKELADIVAFKNSQHKVDLKNAELSVVVEVIKGLCCLTVLPDYNELRKFNVLELGVAKKSELDADSQEKDDDAKPTDLSTVKKEAVKEEMDADSKAKEDELTGDDKPTDLSTVKKEAIKDEADDVQQPAEDKSTDRGDGDADAPASDTPDNSK